ncbi:class I SAM-dependent methyltransferase [Terrisporobacter glycolicus]|uniref:class I SAM-dependent methyltransferase n=1 Tax=Terrisporobacter petrolearius TaxID=1460447 RepID=UPI0008E7FE94|nr:demethylmenaquinone methyltransferase / 2-methoxy-6-polyprenyl-1,4-benzoquinol methylase [Terrisporobacter glycolicus]
MGQADFFNSVAKNWDNMINVDESKINYLLNKLKIQEDDEILDIGTGTGVLIPFLNERVCTGRIKGVDISEGMLEVAKSKFNHLSNVDFDLVNVEKEELKYQYDKIILYSMYPHLENKTQTISNLVKDSLKEDGILMIAHSDSREFLNNLHRNSDERVHESILMEINEQKNVFINAGLKVIEAFENDEMYYVVIEKN